MKFLVDECLTIELVTIANQAGFHAEHVARVGKAGWQDWNVLGYARAGEFVLVTNNRSDFRRLYATEPLHAGLVIIVPNLGGRQQQSCFSVALAWLQAMGEPLNQVLEVDVVDGEVVTAAYDLPG